MYQSIETALHRHDDIVQLLVSLGADVNAVIRSSNDRYNEEKLSILDWLNIAIRSMEIQLKEAKKPGRDLLPVDFSTLQNWKEYACLAATVSSYSSSYQRPEKERLADIELMESAKRYFEDVKELLISNDAKTLTEPKGDKNPTSSLPLVDQGPESSDSQSFDNYDFSALFYSANIPRHLVARYHELFEACFKGDNEKIQALCLPPEGAQSDETPLQITVQLRNGDHLTGQLTTFRTRLGLTLNQASLHFRLPSSDVCGIPHV